MSKLCKRSVTAIDYWYTHLSRHVWITAMDCWLILACLFANGSSESRIVLRVWSALIHATPLLRRLHLLPVARRIMYKLCVLRFDVFFDLTPIFLTDIIAVAASDSRLRYSARGNFVVRRTRTRFADSSFAVAGPAAWNSLPVCTLNIDAHLAFCRQLKTYEFTVPDWITVLHKL